MAQIKISGLPVSSNLNTNPTQSIFPTTDLGTGQTTRLDAKSLGTSLYANNNLTVGTGGILLPNLVAQFTGISSGYTQVNEQNINNQGTADYIVTADIGNDTNYYIDMGITNSQYSNVNPFNSLGTAIEPLSGYLYVTGNTVTNSSGNLVIGTTNPGTETRIFAGGVNDNNVIIKIKYNDVKFRQNTIVNVANTLLVNTVTFYDGTSANSFSAVANATNSIVYITGVNTSQNTNIQAAFNRANLANSIANTAVQNTAVVQLQALTLTGNLIANSVGQGIFVDSFTSNNATFSKNMVVLGNLQANTLLGNIFFSNVVTTTSQSNTIIWYPQASIPPQQTGQLFYYSNTQSLILDTDIAGDRLSISKVLFFRGYNSTGSIIPANSFVRLTTGVTTNNIPYITLADATSSANATVAGFVKNAIANGAYGFAYSQGIVEDLNSTGLGQNGDILFLSTTPGIASNVVPGGANTVVQLGRIILSDATQGKIFVQNQLRQAYGRPNGQLLYAYANNIIGSNTISINDSTGILTAKDITANTLTTSNGIINTVRVGSSSPLTINFTTDTIVRANLSANFTVTPASFVAGKTIDVWLTNTSSGGGANHTITHGVSALNSTVGGTTFTLAGPQSALLRYMCADGTLANTFVAITYQ